MNKKCENKRDCKYGVNDTACMLRQMGGGDNCYVPDGVLRIEDERSGLETEAIARRRELWKNRKPWMTIYG